MNLTCNSCDGIYDALDVRFTRACDNRCSFCIERHGVEARPSATVEEMASAMMRSGMKDVLILGGEPMLEPTKVLEYLWRIRTYAAHIWLTTSLPSTAQSEWPIWCAVMVLLDGLNVSVQDATDEMRNNLKFMASKPHDRLKVLARLNSCFADKIRVSIFLGKTNIYTMALLRESLSALSDLGCRHIKICELQRSPGLYVSYEEISGHALPSPFAHGCSCGLADLSTEFGMNVELKRSCFMTELSRKATWADTGKAVLKLVGLGRTTNRFGVLYEDAKLERGWLSAD